MEVRAGVEADEGRCQVSEHFAISIPVIGRLHAEGLGRLRFEVPPIAVVQPNSVRVHSTAAVP
jgi:hypothetical protein